MNKSLFSSQSSEWTTPQSLFDDLNLEFNFTLDPAATKENAKCTKFFTLEDDGLIQDWSKERVFCNPPYGRVIGMWVKKMATEEVEICVGLLPARTDTRWFHEYIYNKAEIRFLQGRIKFGDSKNSAPFPSMIVVWNKKSTPPSFPSATAF